MLNLSISRRPSTEHIEIRFYSSSPKQKCLTSILSNRTTQRYKKTFRSYNFPTGSKSGSKQWPQSFTSSIFLSDLSSSIISKRQYLRADVLFCANDLAIYRTGCLEVQQIFIRFQYYVTENDLEINFDKAKVLASFEAPRGSGTSSKQHLIAMLFFKHLYYLRLTLSCFQAYCTESHVTERVGKTPVVGAGIERSSLLFLNRTILLFNIKPVLTAFNGIQFIQENVNEAQLCTLQQVEAAFYLLFLCQAMGLHASCYNRYVYLGTPLFFNGLQRQFGLSKTPIHLEFI